MDRKCEHCGKEFSITEGELSMYQKVGIELPALCFFCRVKLHLSFWLFGKFRKIKSDLSGENLITVLPEKSRYPIYSLKEWYSDAWEGMDYGRDYNPEQSFFEQLKELQEKIPHPHQNGANNTLCEWSDDVWNSKNCYLSRSMEECEDLLYSYRNIKVKNSIDVTVCYNLEKSFDSTNCHNSFKLFYSRNSRDCIDSYFLFDCRNCQNCFMCSNLRGKSYCIENVQYTKEEYNKKIESFSLDSYESIQNHKKRFEEISKKVAIHRENFNIKAYNSMGDQLTNVNDCHNCYIVSESENCYNSMRGLRSKSCIDVDGCWYSELSGNCSACVNGYAQKYCVWASSRNSLYLDLCIECDECFGCVGLKKKKNCILNKQYGEDEYKKLKSEIISDMKERGEYGKFLPYSMSPGPFNFSTSYLYFPEVKKEEITKLGGYWEDLDENHIEGMPTSELSDSIKDVPDDICSQALICPETGWRFNIAPNELIFYKQNNIPLPRKHFDVRTKDRLKYVSVLEPSSYSCYYCKKEIKAYYPKDWGYENIACEECYQNNLN